jgi:uncharacterized protein YoxC
MISEYVELYGQLGAAGVICVVFIMLIMNLIKSQKAQTEDIDEIRQHQAIMETTVKNVEGIIIKLIDRFGRSDENSERNRKDVIKELNDLSDVVMEVKGAVSRINGRH